MSIPRTQATFSPPIIESARWLEGVTFPPDRPLINVSQAAPVDPPPRGLREAMAKAALEDDSAHLYGDVLGETPLREATAARASRLYGGAISGTQMAITSGCNQAFAAAIASLCDEGDAIILPVPWYFNHKMWLDMAGVTAVPLSVGIDMLPSPEAARALITPRTRAIALVSPNNPAGVEYPPELLRAFLDLARAHGIALILDETYRDFHTSDGAPHDLFTDPEWHDTLIHLYSFSKAYRLTGHRLGAVASNEAQIAEIEKFLDTVTICPAQIGQRGALWALENLDDWLAGERAEILARAEAIRQHMPQLEAKGWHLRGLGGYFAYLEHPFAMTSAELAPEMVRQAGVLALPASMFFPEGDPQGDTRIRVAFANLDAAGIATMVTRLTALDLPRR